MLGTIQTGSTQQSDFQFWPQIQVGYALSSRFKITLEEEVRLRENASLLKKELTDLGLTCKITRFLRLGLNYRLELTSKNPDDKSWRSGLYGDIMLRQKLQRFQFDYRIRFQSPKIESIDEATELQQLLKNRHKLSVEYNIKGIPLTPEMEAEIFIPVVRKQPLIIDEYRLWIKLSYALNKRHEVGIKYGVQREINVADPLTAYILGISYSLDIN
ncbi:MAG: DUF2490 domain-containing protein [Bacteroidales bacterium]|nr:DUF2490 domain-containing protein [Bacteroidales bacterium]